MSGGRGTGGAAPVALVGGRVALLLGPDLGSSLLAKMKEAVFAEDPVEAVVRVLSSVIRQLPSFGCVIRDEVGIRLLLRGSVTAVIRTYSGPERKVAGEAVSTWAEHVIRDPREVVIVASAPSPDASTLVLLFESPKPSRRRSRPTVQASGRDERSREVGAYPSGAVEPIPWSPPPEPHRSDETIVTPAPMSRPEPRPPAPPVPVSRPPAPRPPPARPPVADEGEVDFSHLLDETQYRGVEAAAVRDDLSERRRRAPCVEHEPSLLGDSDRTRPPIGPPPNDPRGRPFDDNEGDHDGDTVAARGTAGPPARESRMPTRPQVQAVRCAAGHSNPPLGQSCRLCGQPIVDRAIKLVDRPSLGRLRFDDGLVVELDRPLLVGRKPDHQPVPPINGESPGIVALPDPDKALSRLHLEVQIEDWHVLVVDRGSANGTLVEIPGHDGEALRPNQRCMIIAGTRVTLAEAASLTYEVDGW